MREELIMQPLEARGESSAPTTRLPPPPARGPTLYIYKTISAPFATRRPTLST